MRHAKLELFTAHLLSFLDMTLSWLNFWSHAARRWVLHEGQEWGFYK